MPYFYQRSYNLQISAKDQMILSSPGMFPSSFSYSNPILFSANLKQPLYVIRMCIFDVITFSLNFHSFLPSSFLHGFGYTKLIFCGEPLKNHFFFMMFLPA